MCHLTPQTSLELSLCVVTIFIFYDRRAQYPAIIDNIDTASLLLMFTSYQYWEQTTAHYPIIKYKHYREHFLICQTSHYGNYWRAFNYDPVQSWPQLFWCQLSLLFVQLLSQFWFWQVPWFIPTYHNSNYSQIDPTYDISISLSDIMIWARQVIRII